MLTGGTYTPPLPSIGAAYGGGFFAGQINVSGTKYNLVVAPKASGENSSRAWGPTGTTTGITSDINGPTNSASLSALGTDYQAARFCENLTIGGFSDWYLPAKNELEVLYYFLKPSTASNSTSSGSNANAVSPEPVSTTYTTGAPSQTVSGINFRLGESEAFVENVYWTSTEATNNTANRQSLEVGSQGGSNKGVGYYVRAVRRIAV